MCNERTNYVMPWDFSIDRPFIIVDTSRWLLSEVPHLSKDHSAAYGDDAIMWYCSADYKTREEAQEAADRGNRYRTSKWPEGEICNDFVVREVE